VSIHYDVRLDLSAIEERIDAALPEALRAGMDHIKAVSQSLVPVETGRLVGSADVQVAGDEASLSYAGPYARYQHERLDLHHPHGGQGKYLEQPVLTHGQQAVDTVADHLRQAL